MFKPKQEVMFSAPQQRMTAPSVYSKRIQRGGAQYNRGPPLGVPKISGVCSLLRKGRALDKRMSVEAGA